MSKQRQYTLISLTLIVILGLGGYFWRDNSPAPAPALKHSYAKSLAMAHNGQPGAARVLYQQLARTDLSAIRRAGLYQELPNYPSPLALKLATRDLQHDDQLVRRAAIASIGAMLPDTQRSLVLGPLLDDEEPRVRFAVVDALLGLGPDDIGLYFGPLQHALEQYQQVLAQQTDDPAAQLHLARLYLHENSFKEAAAALEQTLKLDPENLEALAVQVQLLERQGQTDASRQVLATALQQRPDSAFLQHELGKWLLRHGQDEYALLAFARALELDPDNNAYRYTLATSLHQLEQVEPAQKQLEALLSRDPANRKARVLLIEYWKETGQMQNVQVLLAQLEQLNPDDPLVQQGL
ncbi:tetratricopeptide repeat protein [Pseudomonas sp. P66]|jgi:tetratricopeptide (TPR) repeat protein|uniref:Tetratricopeptide repeat protein n=1 Tax=Pseudomonas arcuscaelestis TaxID=2710591 RepID=A0ABS2C439_9PSED|nr:HEAT repeat domain-containing protein [Pseudomonas arcuscaelestis]MBM3103662.1 tetratricopeptide repeat protein [Pseudomonas arcuscaelestis]MBM3110379.1 tetratricopeptide repeat protein [Pseudomonas arcuscaelestis]MBM5459784.1 tetratricopeptide repeat protein [Pseudomonas arcuscaelestis]